MTKPRNTMTRRTPVTPETEVPLLDLGFTVVPKGTTVTARTVGGDKIVGTLTAVDYRDGVPHTATVYTDGNYRSARHVYVDTVTVKS